MNQIFAVTGMSCAVCQTYVGEAVSALAGVKSARVNLLSNCLTVDYNEKLIFPFQIVQAIKKSGYKAQVQSEFAVSVQTVQGKLHRLSAVF